MSVPALRTFLSKCYEENVSNGTFSGSNKQSTKVGQMAKIK